MKSEIISRPISLEHPNVKRVLKIAEDIMSANKVLNIDNLYHIAKRTLKIPRKGLLSIIQFLINKKILIEGSKYSRKTVLLNRTRNKIYKFIKKHQAVHFSHIRKTIGEDSSSEGASSGQLIWHLEMLIKFNYIKKLKLGNYTIFSPIELDEEPAIINFLLHDTLNKEIISLVHSKKSLKRSKIYKILEQKRETVYYHVANLIECEILTLKEKEGKDVIINPKKKKIIESLLKGK